MFCLPRPSIEFQKDRYEEGGTFSGHRIVRAHWVAFLSVTLLGLMTSEGVCGQDAGELQIFFLSGSSDTPAFTSYSGIGISSAFSIPGFLRIRWVFDIESTSAMREGWVCAKNLSACEVEPGILDETRRDNVALTLQAVLPLGDRIRLSAATGPLYSNLHWESTSESQRRGDVPPPSCYYNEWVEGNICRPGLERGPLNEHQKRFRLGVVLSGDVRLQPLSSLPLVIAGGWDRKVFKMEGCTTKPRTYAPFCGWAHSNEWRVGVGYLF
jgi:hypothetical protein